MDYQKLFEMACKDLADGQCNLSVCETGTQLCEATQKECVQCWMNYFIKEQKRNELLSDDVRNG